MDVLKIENVSKRFGDNQAIQSVSFSVPERSVFGFIGENGAGKTTTIKIILGLLRSDGGEIFVNGERVTFGQNHTNQYIGYLPDVPEFYGFMTPMEYLKMCGEITGMKKDHIQKKSGDLLELVGLEKTNKRIHHFSRGMKQRLGIAQALLNSPKLLICDEPTSALDPIGRKDILDILCSVKEHTTVIFSTHILSDVERICDRVAFLHNGKVAFSGSLNEIRGLRKGDRIEVDFVREADTNLFANLYKDSKRMNETRLQFLQKSEDDMQILMRSLAERNIAVLRLEKLEPTLEDLFLEVAKK